MGILGLTTIGMSLLGFSVLKSKTPSKYVKKLKKSAKLFDYGSGIYMSRLPFFLGYLLTASANILAARNSTERKDLAIRQGIGTVIFFGGDLLLSSLFTNLSDRIFGTKLRKDDASNKYLINKIFPKVKPFKQVIEEVKHGKISKVNKKVAAGIFWSDMLLLMGAMGYAVPTAINKMIKHDVEKDVQEQNKSNTGISISEYTKPIRMNDFIKKIREQQL